MFSGKKLIIIIISVIVLISNLTFADWRDNAKVIDVSGGENHTLVLTKNKTVWACGPNGDYPYNTYFGVLGTGSNDPSLTKTTLVRVQGGAMNTPHLQDINNIAAGWKHSLALDINGFVWSWGDNFEGQLGDKQDTGPDGSSTPVQVHGVDNVGYLRYIIAISAGRSGEHSLAVDANNLVYAWGMNKEGQLGNDQNGVGERELTPVEVNGVNGQGHLQNIIVVSGGADHSMALEELDPFDPNCKGRVYTWGSNKWPGDGESYQSGRGKLGDGSIVDLSDTPVRVLAGQQEPNDPNAYLKNIIAISAGWNHCMALEKDDPNDPNCNGRVYTWGSNGEGYGDLDPCSIGGRLGDGTYTDRSTPVFVLAGKQNPNDPNSHLKHIVAIAAGEGHSLALDNNGNVYAWGDNQFGQLGNGTNDPCTTPVRVLKGQQDTSISGYLENIVAISAGHWHCIAVDADGTIWTWGKGAGGRLDDTKGEYFVEIGGCFMV
jgi:alpha-tubulin suppressor-like RCC1 family protein